jgi:hypothetical protein
MQHLLTIVLLIIPVFEEPPKCKENPRVVAACYPVHGRATFGNGTPALRIWPVGSKRMLGVTAGSTPDDAEEPIAPKNFAFPNGALAVYGDFEVYPFPSERKGSMRMVCVQSPSPMVVKD